MLSLTIAEVAQILGVPPDPTAADAQVLGCTTDSRQAESGQLFFALRGPSFDAHRFVEDARRRGVAAAVVERRVESTLAQIVVPDARAALGRLAKDWRRRFTAPVVGVTGSNGKTTVKEMTASCLRAATGSADAVLATHGNFNNEIGLPLTVLRQCSEHRYAVLEMGANHPGEIAMLADIAAPDVGIITQCAPAHLEGFGSIEGVARAKGELFSALPPNGTAVINADDPFCPMWTALARHCHRVTFGLRGDAEVRARYVAEDSGTRMVADTPAGRFSTHLPLPGRHNVQNALGVIAACLALGLSPETIRSGLESVPAVAGRLRARQRANGVCVLDDTYNANPASLAAALEVLGEQPGRRWLVLGDMAELGCKGPQFHAEAGEAARRSGVERLFTLGDLSANAGPAFGGCAHHFPEVEALNAELLRELEPGVTVLVKGSRSMRMERVVNALLVEE